MKVLFLALIVCLMPTFQEGLALSESVPQQQPLAQQLPDWINNWLDEVKSLLAFIESINKILWSQQIKPLLVEIINDIKTGHIGDKTVKDLIDLLKNAASLVYIDSVDLVFGLSKSFQDLLEQIWDHRHDIQEFIVQTLYTLYVLTFDFIFYVLVYLLPALQTDLQKAWTWVKEILKKIFGQKSVATTTRSLSDLTDLPAWLQKLVYHLVNLLKYIERVLASLPAELKKILEQLQSDWLVVWNNVIIPAIQAFLDYLSKHDPKLEHVVEVIIFTLEYVYIFTVAVLAAEFELVEKTVEFVIKVLEKIFHGLN